MPLKIKCPSGHVLIVPRRRAGTTVRCPKCQKTVNVPKLKTSPPASEPAPDDKQTARTVPPAPPPKSKEVVAREVEEPSRPPLPMLPSSTKRDAPKPPPVQPASSPPAKNQSAKPSPPKGDESKLHPPKLPPLKRTKPVLDHTREKQTPPQKREVTAATAHVPPDKPAAPREAAAQQPDEKRDDKPKTTPPPVKPTPKPTIDASAKPTAPPQKAATPSVAAEPKPPARIPSPTSEAPTKAVETVAEPEKKPPPLQSWQPTKPAASSSPTSSAAIASAEPERPKPRGVEHSRERRWKAYYLAIAIAVIALFSMGPAVYDIVSDYWSDPPQPIARWAYAALFLGLLQSCYALYLAQLPDWSTVWVASVLSLLLATMYAMLVVVFLLSTESSQLMSLLGLSGPLRMKAAMWSFSMLSVMSTLAFFAGRAGLHWQKTHSLSLVAKADSQSA